MRGHKLLFGAVSGLVLTLQVSAEVLYVDVSNPTPSPPYATWATAANVIQVAIDASSAGDIIIVTNGVYQSGGHNYANDVVNRVALSKPVTVTSVNGPTVTTILGDVYPHYAYGARCAYLTNGAVLSGFTLSQGKASLGHDTPLNRCGGAVYCESTAVVSNCIVKQNSSSSHGGAGYRGTYINCVFSGNNTSGGYGGGAAYATLINCTVAGNSAYVGGGVNASSLQNCIVCFNGSQILGICQDWYSSSLTRCCAGCVDGSAGNINVDPLFVDFANGDLHLQANSPCINAGLNAAAPPGTDVEGNARIAGGTVDIGAYEFPTPTSVLSYAWLQQYGLPTDGSSDYADPDGDGMNNWQEWRAGTNPTDALSVLRMLTPSMTNNSLVISWQSVNGITYSLERSTGSGFPANFLQIQSDIAGQSGTTTYTDTNAVGASPALYRVVVQ
jgi:hypothetical protein